MSPVAPGVSTQFSVSYDPSAVGSHTASVSFLAGGSPFSFQVTGNGTTTGLPGISIADVTGNEGNSGTTSLSFVVSISPAPTANVTVNWATANDTATAPSDYTTANGTLTFSPAVTSQNVQVAVQGDTTVEPSERFFVDLSGVSAGAQIVDSQGIGTIQDDDSPVEITMKLTNSWSGGFNADLEIKNKGVAAVNGWTLEFDFVPTISSLWSGSYTNAGARYTISPVSWTTNIPAGGAVTPGFTADGTLTAGSVSNAVFNGSPVIITVNLTSGGGGGGGGGAGSAIAMPGVDGVNQAVQVTINHKAVTASTQFDLSITGVTTPAFTVATNNPTVVTPSIVAGKLQLVGEKAGRAGIRITETGSGSTRYIGVRVRTAAGALPDMPEYIGMGSVSEDTTPDLTFWRSFEPGLKNKRIDYRYIYLNGGATGAIEPYNPSGAPPQTIDGWYGWAGGNGNRARNYIRESRKLGIIPAFVYYNIATGNESYDGDLARVRSKAYMEYYYKDLKKALEISRDEAGDDLVMFIFEPDFMGYIAQNHLDGSGVPIAPNTPKTATGKMGAWAEVNAAYSSGVLNTAAGDPLFPDTFRGLIESINYITNKYPNVVFGWQMNLWAYPAGGFTGISPTVKGIMHFTDPAAATADFATRRQQIYTEARAVTKYRMDAGFGTHGADFISIDKYGLDAVGYEAVGATDPAATTWFFNADHWGNYLRYCKAMHDESGLPVVLWQLPVGRVNTSQETNPYGSGLFPNLPNTHTKYEDSSPSYFLGDTFIPGAGNRLTHFSRNLGGDTKVTIAGGTVTWGEHINEAKAAGISTVLFGAGVGQSTDGVGDPPTEDYWWITKVQKYYQHPVPR
ncbi:MAG: cellulose binding domain-containing protein [Planctomycetes bacterium]|nr:cellulose binding domain-containing protein [Planctomycetota bacterium]